MTAVTIIDCGLHFSSMELERLINAECKQRKWVKDIKIINCEDGLIVMVIYE